MKLTTSNATVTNTVVSSKLTIGNNAVVESLSLGSVSINTSAIAVGNVSITPAAISTPQLVLGGTVFTGSALGGIVDYQQFTANGTWYNPYANASVNASLTGYEQVFVMAWGGGGGGNANTGAWGAGGGGGACFVGTIPLSSFTNTCAVTVGLGGAGISSTASGQAAGTGGMTTFVINSISTIAAYGGGGMVSATSFGPGGGILGAGIANSTVATGGAPLGGTKGNPGGASTFGGGGGGNATASYLGGNSIFGGSGAANGVTIYGGAGYLGSSVFGGQPGAAPGGGGVPVTGNASASSGARGEVRVWVIGPSEPTPSINLLHVNVVASATMTIPSGAAPGNFALWAHSGVNFITGIPTETVIDSSWTEITPAGGSTGGLVRSRMHYKILTQSDIGASYNGQTGTAGQGHILYIFRTSRPIAQVTVNRQNSEATLGNPVQQTISIDGLTSPLIAFGYGSAASFDPISITYSSGLTIPSGFPTADWFMPYGVFNFGSLGNAYGGGSSASNQTVDIGDVGDGNHLHSGYISFSF